MSQNQNQRVEYISGFLDKNEMVNESEFEEPTGEQEADKLAANQQKKQEGEERPKNVKRPRKTIEQEIAELDAKRERLMDKKRRQEAHEKIVFGSTVIAMLKDMKKRNDRNGPVICKTIQIFTEVEYPKYKDIVNNIIKKI